MTLEFLSGCYNVLSNSVLGKVLLQKLQEIDPPKFLKEDQEFAKGILETIPERYKKEKAELKEKYKEKYGIDIGDKILCDFIVPEVIDKGVPTPGSTDVGDVSYVVPTAQAMTVGGPIGATTHSWQFTATAGMHIGHEGMLLAAQALGLSGIEMSTHPELIEEAKKEFEKQRGDEKYVSPLPDDLKPQLNLVKH
jgi:aminobenzoyl-glutamate utilization protein B